MVRERPEDDVKRVDAGARLDCLLSIGRVRCRLNTEGPLLQRNV